MIVKWRHRIGEYQRPAALRC